MDPKDAITTAREVGKHVTDYVKFADAKAGLILTFAVAVGSALAGTAPPVLKAASDTSELIGVVLGIALIGIAGAVAATLWHATAAISPRADTAHAPLVSFPDIAKVAPGAYADLVARASETDVLRDYALHNHALSCIAAAKYAALAMAARWARVALFGAFLAAVMFAVVKARS